jgi:UPF0271 protein
MIQDSAITSASGKVIPVKIDTVCIHGDTPGAVDIARKIREELERNGIKVAPFSSPR